MGRLSGRCRVTRSGPARLWIAAIALGAAVAPPAPAAPAPPAERLADDARQYERLGQWDKACQAYVQLLAADRTRPELHDIRQTVRDLAWEAHRLVGLSPTVVAFEFACGACHALDEYTLFLTPGQPLDGAALGGDLAAFGLLMTYRDRGLVVERVAPG